MWSRRDQIQAYQFLRRRTVSAVLVGDANHAESPTRLGVAGVISGVVASALLLGGFGIYGVLRPGNSTAWQTAEGIIVEKESGTRFIRRDDGRLHPVRNYASERLIVGGEPDVVSVSRKSLAAAPRGRAIGIVGAPDSLPTPELMNRGSWTACSTTTGVGSTVQESQVEVLIGDPPAKGAVIPLDAEVALVAVADEETYLLADGRRFKVAGSDPERVLAALSFDAARTPRITVPLAWLSVLQAGPDLRFPSIPGRGDRTENAPTPGARVGQLFSVASVDSDRKRFYVLLEDGLAAISSTQAQLVMTDPRVVKAYPDGDPVERTLPTSTWASAAISTVDLTAGDYPRVIPQPLAVDDRIVSLCLSPTGLSDGLPAVQLGFAAGPVPISADLSSVPVAESGVPISAGAADAIAIAPGSGALVRGISSEVNIDAPVFLVTDLGARFAIPDEDSRAALGYAGVPIVDLPAAMVALLTLGPSLGIASATEVPAP